MMLSIILAIVVVGLIVLLAVSYASKKKLDEKCNQLERDLKTKTDETDGVVSAKGQLEEQVAELNASIKELGDAVADRDGNIKCLLEKQRVADSQICEYQKEIKRLYAVISTNDATIAELKAKETDFQDEIGRLKEAIAGKEVSETSLKAKFDEAIFKEKESSRKLEQLKGEFDDLKGFNESLKTQNDGLHLQMDGLKSEMEHSSIDNAQVIEQLRKANEEIEQCKKEIEEQNHLIESRDETIEKLQHDLALANEMIQDLKGIIESLQEKEDADAHFEEAEKEDDDAHFEVAQNVEDLDGVLHGNDNSIKKSRTTSDVALFRRPTHQYEQKKETDDAEPDLPIIKNENGEVQRSIIFVRDLEAKGRKSYIYANEFFKRSPEEIARISRYLAEANEDDHDVYVCSGCGNRVKIAKRDFGTHEVLFFSHCKKQVDCCYIKDYGGLIGNGSGGVLNAKELERYRFVKSVIVNSLQTNLSQDKGVSLVVENAIIRSNDYPVVWRRANVLVKYGNRRIAFELFTKHTLLNDVISKDVFYQKNKKHVVWILGADEEFGYDYFRKHVAQNTIFANHKNAFFVDGEALAACEEKHELVLKCNYLEPDGKWHFRKETTGNNGVLVTIDQLHFDDDSYKPYCFDSLIEDGGENEDYGNMIQKEVGLDIAEVADEEMDEELNSFAKMASETESVSSKEVVVPKKKICNLSADRKNPNNPICQGSLVVFSIKTVDVNLLYKNYLYLHYQELIKISKELQMIDEPGIGYIPVKMVFNGVEYFSFFVKREKKGTLNWNSNEFGFVLRNYYKDVYSFIENKVNEGIGPYQVMIPNKLLRKIAFCFDKKKMCVEILDLG